MEDKLFELYKKSVWSKLPRESQDVIPQAWWESVIKHYYKLGYSEDRTVRVILETMGK